MGRLRLFNWLARILLAMQLVWLPQAVMAAAYATGGSGKYKNEILWLTWGDANNPLGKSGVTLKNGDTSMATIPVANGANLSVSCSIADIATPSNKPLKSYRPGDWRGDTLDDAYNVSGTEGSNQLINGIVGDSGVSSFTGRCCRNRRVVSGRLKV